MSVPRTALLSVCLFICLHGSCQQGQVKGPSLAIKGQAGPKFGYLQCRADAQRWTVDPFDGKDERNLAANAAITVNGQFRAMPHTTPHVTVAELMKRRYEMDVCVEEDHEFEKQYATYSYISKSYDEEILFRYDYFLIQHNLREQFFREDADANR